MTSLNKALSTAIDELTCDDFGVACLGDSGCEDGHEHIRRRGVARHFGKECDRETDQ